MGFAVLECSALRLMIHTSVILCYGINKHHASDLNYKLIHPETNRALLIYPSWEDGPKAFHVVCKVMGCDSSCPPPLSINREATPLLLVQLLRCETVIQRVLDSHQCHGDYSVMKWCVC